jgi:hypothetical protein
MYHTIEFGFQLMVDLEVSPRKPLERMLIHAGTRMRAQLKPYVIEGQDGPTEVADLYFEAGPVTRAVPFAHFRFVDE